MKHSLLLLRLALAFALLYAGISALVTPDNWVGWFPQYMFDIIPEHIALVGHSILEIILAIWVLSGWKVWIPAIIFVLAMVGIVVFNFSQMDIVFRDISLALAALALASATYNSRSVA